MKTISFFLLFTLTGLLQATKALGESTQTVFQYLTKQEGVSMTLECDLTAFVANKRSNDYFPAVLITDDGTAYPVEIKARGRFRRMKAEIPPLKIRFGKGDLQARGFDAYNEIKVALPMEGGAGHNELVVKEYLAYRMFEQLTDTGIRARLVKLSIRDLKDDGKKPQEFSAIFMEDEEEAAARLGGTLVEQYGLATEQLDVQQAALVTLFQYMIGNADWDFEMQRNIRFVQLPGSGKILPLPYDFDFSGLVNAPYASPASGSGLDNVRDRILMAKNLPADAMYKARKILIDQKADFYRLCGSGFLSKNTSNQMIRYLNRFFNEIEKEEELPVVLRH
jgi:hypothetical protein